MSLSLPTLQELFDQKLSDFESGLSQTAPDHDQAFLRVLSATLSMQDKAFYQLAVERTKQNLVLTAFGDDLDRLGQEYVVPRKQAVQAEMTATITTSVDVPALTTFISDSTQELYRTTALASPSGGIATLNLKSVLGGADYTLAIDDTLTIQVSIAGCGSTATITAVATEGLDKELDPAYKRRIQTEMRTVGGGGNNADYRTWAEAVDGVERAFPYSGCSDNHNRLEDGDMEASDVSAWTPGSGTTLTKETGTPYEGVRCLRITRGAFPGYATQSVFARYTDYNISGYARGDGTSNPKIEIFGSTLWTGTSSTDWQYFDIDLSVASGTSYDIIYFLTSNGGSSNYTEWDDITILQTSAPGDVTVIVECSTSLDADGIPDQTLLDAVYDAILEDPITGIHRPTLGILDENIYVEPISRTSVDLEIRGLSVPAAVETQAKSEISDSVDSYLRQIIPFVEGLDSEYSNNSLLTDLTLSQYIQDILTTYGGSADGIGISVDGGSSFVSSYQVGMGEMLKKGTITYV